ncbi:MAG TPA: Holliday junction branch migration protein RuvA [Candidatus Binataceae bacterium]|nr:Holliday junction branch migration protein RuvA [Candidatus Binataceae bacterium]
MIASLNGKLKIRESDRLVVESAGVGYEVFVPLATYYRMPSVGMQVELEIRQVVREDAIALYGFATRGEKRAFDLLLKVQHVGPTLALKVLSVLSPKEIASAIGQGDVERLDAVPGVGPKVAERIVRELRDKLGELDVAASELRPTTPDGASAGGSLADDALSALVNLGYKPAEAKRAVEATASTGHPNGDGRDAALENLIRQSLAVLLGEK